LVNDCTASTGATVLAHSGLADVLSDLAAILRASRIKIEFVDARALRAASVHAGPILVGVTSERHVEFLGSLREQHGRAPIIAVVDDVTGQSTHLAIKAGASVVYNLAIPFHRRVDGISAVLPASPSAARTRPSMPALDDKDRLLVNLLCGPQSVAEIARRFFCSERSLYRRIRRLYNTFGVTGRSELRSAIAVFRASA
jgi:DNA-binding NarL/FixJ family response regulator